MSLKYTNAELTVRRQFRSETITAITRVFNLCEKHGIRYDFGLGFFNQADWNSIVLDEYDDDVVARVLDEAGELDASRRPIARRHDLDVVALQLSSEPE